MRASNTAENSDSSQDGEATNLPRNEQRATGGKAILAHDKVWRPRRQRQDARGRQEHLLKRRET